MDRQTDRQTDRQAKDEWKIDKRKYLTNGQIEKLTNCQMDKWTNGLMDKFPDCQKFMNKCILKVFSI